MEKLFNKTILIIDDDKMNQVHLKSGLGEKGFKVFAVDSAQEGIDFVIKNLVDLIILDLNLPDRDGMSVIEFLRSFNNVISIIVLTKRSNIDDKVLALDAGANDYMVKPYSFLELLARVKKEFRYKKDLDEHILTNGPLSIDYGAKMVFVNGKEVHLTNFEYKILLILATNIGKTVSYESLINAVWGKDGQDQNGLRVFMAGIRKKIEKDKSLQKIIRTCVGIGYRMDIIE